MDWVRSSERMNMENALPRIEAGKQAYAHTCHAGMVVV